MGWPWLDQACCGVVSNVVCCDVSTLRGAVFKLSAAPLPPSKPATGNTAEIEDEEFTQEHRSRADDLLERAREIAARVEAMFMESIK